MADMQADMGAQAGLSGGQMNTLDHAKARAAEAEKVAFEYASKYGSSASIAVEAIPLKLSEIIETNLKLAAHVADQAERLALLLSGPDGGFAKNDPKETNSTLVERASHLGAVLGRIERSVARISVAL
jgi:hypothetical protein